VEKKVKIKGGHGCHDMDETYGGCPHAHGKQDIKVHVEVDTVIEK
jgi:hypothetical protein